MPSVFLCHSTNDKPVVRRLATCLRKFGIDVWLDEAELKPGDSLIGAISLAIDKVQYVIVALSDSSVKSQWVEKEIHLALTKELCAEHPVVLPVVLDDCEVPAMLNDKVYLDLRKPHDFKEQCSKLASVITASHGYLGRIQRAKAIVSSLKDAIQQHRRSGKALDVRMRATWTSMSNIAHYQRKHIFGLFPSQAKRLDALLVEERKEALKLLAMPCVSLQCICFPLAKFLSDRTYNEREKQKRAQLLRTFFRRSSGQRMGRRKVVCDRAGAYGNQLFVGKRLVIVGNPESGGFTKSSVFTDRATVGVLAHEFDKLFGRICASKRRASLLQKCVDKLDREFPPENE